MVQYPFDCDKCELSFDVEGHMDKPPKRRKCPQCEKWCNRVFTPTFVHFLGAGWETNISKNAKRFKQGMDKQEADKFLNDSIEASKKRMKSGDEHYKTMVPYGLEEWEKQGKIKRISEKEAKKRKKVAEKLTKEAFERANLDPTDQTIKPRPL